MESRKWPQAASRLGWLLLIWCASVAALGVAALLLRWLMSAAGMTVPGH
jgi:hypothetical protein